MVRITGGSAKGRRVGPREAFSDQAHEQRLRPSSSKVREAIFDILQREIRGSTFLDLYAGTGAVGIEALSRGAERVEFVEHNDVLVKILMRLLFEMGFEGRAKVIREDAIFFVQKTGVAGPGCDIIFVDPPYASQALLRILPVIGKSAISKIGGVVIAEHYSKNELPRNISGLRFVKDYVYGDTALSRYVREES